MGWRRASCGMLAGLGLAVPGSAQDFVYERLWPTIQQPWYFVNNRSIAVDGRDNVFVVDSFNHRIHRYSTDGQLTSRFGQEGFEPGQFQFPIAIAADPRGNLFVAETNTVDFRRIQKLGPGGAPILEFGDFGAGPGQFGGAGDDELSPFDVEVDANGNLWVSGSNRLQRFDPNGNFIDAIPPFGSSSNALDFVTGFDVAADGEIFALAGGGGEIRVFDPRGNLLRSFGTEGFGPGEIFLGNDLEIGPDGRIYIADGGNSKIIRFEPDERNFIEWGEPGTDPGQFQVLWRLDFDSGGRVYTVDTADDDFGTHRVQKFTADGTFLQEWGSASSQPGRFINPDGMAVDAQGRVFVADKGNDRVQVFSSTGALLFEFGGSGNAPGRMIGPAKVAIGPPPDEKVYVMEFEGGRVQRFTANGEFDGAALPSLELPGAIAIDRQGNVYVTEIVTDRVLKLDPDLEPLLDWGGHTECIDRNTGLTQPCADGAFNEPRSLTVDRSGEADSILVGDYFNLRIQRFDTSGNFISKIESEFFPTAIEADPDGNIFLLPFSNSRGGDGHFFTLLDPSGEPLGFWGEFGSNPGQLNSPVDIALAPDGRVYLADALNHRVVAFAPTAALGNVKSIIVAGGGPFPGNVLWEATQLNANFAYRALSQQGFSRETIQYLSADTDLDLDANGLADDVDADATVANLESAITDWAADADEVVVYLVDHGGDETFRMAGTEILTSTALAGWIDALQDRIPGRITVVYDACQSGSFHQALANPGADRVVITSAAGDQSAFFVDRGALSFSNQFWTQVFNGVSVGDSFITARDIVQASFPTQTPLLNADGDGQFNTGVDFDQVAEQFVGYGAPDNGSRPVIGSVSPPQTISSGNVAPLFAEGVSDENGIARVWAVIRPPNSITPRDPSNPVQALPTQELVAVGPGRTRWEGTFARFDTPGVYTVTFNAADAVGNRAVPMITTVTVESPTSRRALVIDNAVVGAKGLAEPSVPVLQALAAQDYGDDEVTYLANSGSAEVDGAPLTAAIAEALDSYTGGNTSHLLVSLHGGKGSGGGFRLNDGELSADDLDDMFDAVQTRIEGTVTLVYDGDDSGSFLAAVAPVEAQNRIVITSTQPGQAALSELDGQLSFTQAFWEQVELGADVEQAFRAAESFLQSSLSPQVPLLEDNGNGIGNDGTDGQAAQDFSIGVGVVVAGDGPVIGAITPTQILTGEASATVAVSQVTTTGSIDKAAALITPPGAFGSKSVVRNLTPSGADRFELNFEAFTTAGEYQISVYAIDDRGRLSPPAKTRVIQRQGAVAPGFRVNAGISGAWFDPGHDGEGWLIQVLDDATALIYWFTYGPNGEGAGRQVWIGAQTGRIEGPNIIIERMITTAGPSFGPEFDSNALRVDPWGDVTFHFENCNSGEMYYRGREGFGQGLLQLSRITSLEGNACDSPPAAGAARPKGGVVDARMSGAWFDPSHNGEGWLLEILPGGRALSVWFTYDLLGRQQWLIGTGNIDGDTIDFPLLQRPIGAFFGPAFSPAAVDRAGWGSMQFTFDNCNAGAMTYQADDPEIGSGSLQLTPLTKIQGLGCDL